VGHGVVSTGPRLDDFGGLLDWDRLQGLDRRAGPPGPAAPSGPSTQLTGGEPEQHLPARARRRRPGPCAARLAILARNSDSTILREARVLRALRGSAVPHAQVYGVCDDRSVNRRLLLPDGGDRRVHAARGRCRAGMRPSPRGGGRWRSRSWTRPPRSARVRPGDVGLADIGRAEGWLDRQVPRWMSQLEGYQRYPAYAGRTLPHAAEVAEWLERRRPGNCVVGIIHGDLQFANVMFARDHPRLLALIDWELSTLADPLLDLGWILTSWSEPGDPPGHEPYVQPADGLPSRQELVERYLATPPGRDPRPRPVVLRPGLLQSSASSSRAATRERCPGRRRWTSAAACTTTRCGCSRRPRSSPGPD